MESYVVRRCRPGEARGAVEELWQRNLSLEQSAAAKFSWLYEQAPHPPDSLFLLEATASDSAAVTASAAVRAVGTAGVGIREIALGERRLRAGLLADLAVDRDHRTVAPALRLVREVKAWALGELDLAYGFPNQHAQGVFKRVGYVALGGIARYVRVLRHQSYFDRIGAAELARVPAPFRPLAQRVLASDGMSQRVAAAAVDLAQLSRDFGPLSAARLQEKLSFGEHPPSGIDALWRRAAVEHTLLAVRSQRMLQWRYPAQRGRWWAAARQGSRLDAYAIVDQLGDVAHIRDLFGGRAAMTALLRQLVFEAYRRGASSISMRYLGDPWLRDLLRAARFQERSADRTIFIGVSPRLERRVQQMLVDPACWFLTDLDEDV
jgi:hypothetical protein